MKGFISCLGKLEAILPIIIATPALHAKWINTLSYLENCGARKIGAYEHPTLVKEEILKHASEEFRHAHHLKKQIEKIYSFPLVDYTLSNILGGWASLHYLDALDLRSSRYLAETLPKNWVKEYAYIMVTHAIELRAGELYLLYDQLLKKYQSKVSVKSILLEEKEHLNEMQEGIKNLPNGSLYAQTICAIEGELCQNWLHTLESILHQKT